MTESELAAYIRTLSPQEIMVLEIAGDHLESSFDLASSLGFLAWQAEQPARQAEQPARQAEQPARQAEQPARQAEQPVAPVRKRRRKLVRRTRHTETG